MKVGEMTGFNIAIFLTEEISISTVGRLSPSAFNIDLAPMSGSSSDKRLRCGNQPIGNELLLHVTVRRKFYID
ncbi:hypothetical protein NQ317_007391 [Molorchus minor]|uniref:Uncharacterized protein n=1 Tax=Molorchus minor TaxID=1323400 RepID=A0ABQ9JTZ0_9CUCU|nr:hypothetical protein NQ317_007391 [Molorchus minor]